MMHSKNRVTITRIWGRNPLIAGIPKHSAPPVEVARWRAASLSLVSVYESHLVGELAVESSVCSPAELTQYHGPGSSMYRALSAVFLADRVHRPLRLFSPVGAVTYCSPLPKLCLCPFLFLALILCLVLLQLGQYGPGEPHFHALLVPVVQTVTESSQELPVEGAGHAGLVTQHCPALCHDCMFAPLARDQRSLERQSRWIIEPIQDNNVAGGLGQCGPPCKIQMNALWVSIEPLFKNFLLFGLDGLALPVFHPLPYCTHTALLPCVTRVNTVPISYCDSFL